MTAKELRSSGRNISPKTKGRLSIQPRRPRGRPKAEDVAALEARLIFVAREAFALHGYGATSINAIARAARVSKNTFYARFASKGAVFRAIVRRQIANVDEEFLPASEGNDAPLYERLRAYLDVALRRSLSPDMLAINRLIISESHQFAELAEAARARFAEGVEHVAQFIRECARRDRIPCRDPSAAAELLLCAANGWYTLVMITNQVITVRARRAWVDAAVKIFMASRPAW